jgi:outer membrane immunogenic protein
MRKVILASLGVGVFTMPVIAADLRVPYQAVPPIAPVVWSWTGFYIGANSGWIGSWTNSISNTGTDTGIGGFGTFLAVGGIPTTIGISHSGFIGGGQIGYNWQVAPTWVLGLEADFQGASANGNATFAFQGRGPLPPITTVYTQDLRTIGTLRARFGFLSAPNMLWYGTGGLAYGQKKLGTTAACPLSAPPCSTEASTALTSSATSTGWIVGAGFEWMFAPTWSIKAEYLYAGLGNQANTITYTYGPGPFVSSLTSSVRETDNVVRIGVNYKLF